MTLFADAVSASVQAIIKLFVMCLLGYWCAMLGLMPTKVMTSLSKLTILLFMPCLIINNLSTSLTPALLRTLWPLLLWCIGQVLIISLITLLICRVFRPPAEYTRSVIFSNSVPNALKMPLLLMYSLAGTSFFSYDSQAQSHAVVYLTVYQVAWLVIMYGIYFPYLCADPYLTAMGGGPIATPATVQPAPAPSPASLAAAAPAVDAAKAEAGAPAKPSVADMELGLMKEKAAAAAAAALPVVVEGSPSPSPSAAAVAAVEVAAAAPAVVIAVQEMKEMPTEKKEAPCTTSLVQVSPSAKTELSPVAKGAPAAVALPLRPAITMREMVKLSLKRIFINPNMFAIAVGLVVSLVTRVHDALYVNLWGISVTEAINYIGLCTLPVSNIVLAASLYEAVQKRKEYQSGTVHWVGLSKWCEGSLLFSKLVLMPVISFLLVWAMDNGRCSVLLPANDKLFKILVLLQGAMPSAQSNIAFLQQIGLMQPARVLTIHYLWQYLLSIVSMTISITCFFLYVF